MSGTMRTGTRFVTTADGVRIACCITGSGPPLVRVSGWMTHIERDRRGPIWGHWWRELASRHRLIQFDIRGSGLSDRDAPDLGLAGWLRDLEAVMDGLALERAPMLGVCHGGALAAAYAARHPERVSRLVLYASYAAGAYTDAANDRKRTRAETLGQLIALGWGRDNAAFREAFARLVLPTADADCTRWLQDTERLTADPETAARMWTEFHRYDVRDELPRVRAPTLVAHVQGDALVPFEAGRNLAAAIPHARFLPLPGDNHILMPEDEGWPMFVRALREFLAGDAAAPGHVEGSFAGLTPRERAVLEQVAEGFSNAEIAHALGIRDKTVRNHVCNILDKLDLASRAQAIVRAREAGFGHERAS